MNVIPFFNHFDDEFDSILNPLQGYPMYPTKYSRFDDYSQHQWQKYVNLQKYNKDEVNISVSDDKSKIIIHARHNDNEDYHELKKTIDVPKNVQKDKLETKLTHNRFLVVTAPYIQQHANDRVLANIFSDPFHSWGFPLSSEMKRLESEVNKLVKKSFPKSLCPQYVKDDCGNHILQLDFHVLKGFAPEEINVTMDEKSKRITIEASHDQKDDHGSSYKHVKREFDLPSSVCLEEIKTKLMDDGVLRLEAPCSFTDKDDENDVKYTPTKEIKIHRL